MTLYDHFYGPPGWVRWLNAAGWIVSLWLALFPAPYLPLLIVAGLMPPAFIILAAIWPDTFTVEDDDSDSCPHFGRRFTARVINVSGLWMMPCLAIGLRAMMDINLIDILWPFLSGSGLAIVLGLACARVDRRMRHGWALIYNPLLCLCWGWGGLVLANVVLDRSPGRIVAAEVVSRQIPSGDASVELRLPGGEMLSNVAISRALYDRTAVGGTMCVEVNPGVFGWRATYLVDCTGPLLELIRPKP